MEPVIIRLKRKYREQASIKQVRRQSSGDGRLGKAKSRNKVNNKTTLPKWNPTYLHIDAGSGRRKIVHGKP